MKHPSSAPRPAASLIPPSTAGTSPHAVPEDASPAATDPRPVPPEPPLPGDCCQSGCIPCIYDRYEEARERYLAALQAWEARQRGE